MSTCFKIDCQTKPLAYRPVSWSVPHSKNGSYRARWLADDFAQTGLRSVCCAQQGRITVGVLCPASGCPAFWMCQRRELGPAFGVFLD